MFTQSLCNTSVFEHSSFKGIMQSKSALFTFLINASGLIVHKSTVHAILPSNNNLVHLQNNVSFHTWPFTLLESKIISIYFLK